MIIRFHQCRPRIRFPFVAWLIMLFQKMMPWKRSSYSHLAMSYTSSIGTTRYLDSTGKGVRNRTEKNFRHTYKNVCSYHAKFQISESDFLRWIESIEETHYDHLGIFGQMLNKLLGRKLGIGNRFIMISCQEIPLLFFKHFCNSDIGNSDNYDLIDSWNFIENEIKRNFVLRVCRGGKC